MPNSNSTVSADDIKWWWCWQGIRCKKHCSWGALQCIMHCNIVVHCILPVCNDSGMVRKLLINFLPRPQATLHSWGIIIRPPSDNKHPHSHFMLNDCWKMQFKKQLTSVNISITFDWNAALRDDVHLGDPQPIEGPQIAGGSHRKSFFSHFHFKN